MATSNQNQVEVGGPYMVQDMDHMVDSNPQGQTAKRKNIRQSEQSHSESRQQGGDHGTNKPRRQAH